MALELSLATEAEVLCECLPYASLRSAGTVASIYVSAAVTKKFAAETSVQKSCHIDFNDMFMESLSIID